MARNQEKAQSMLYRFREAQATSLGLSPKPNVRRPRLASTVTSLKEAEKWRGEVIREISRKVSKIQDFGLTDYEVRDLNDEINKLLREKGHWENQILALGGANYKRGVPSILGDEGKVGGKGGYKYFGRAKDLPGVKELFERRGTEGEEGGRREDRWERFRNLPRSYYGDEDEDDGVLLEEERKEEEREWRERYLALMMGVKRDLRPRDAGVGEEEEMYISDNEEEGSNGGIQVPTIPRRSPKPWKESMQALAQSYDSQYAQPEDASSTLESGKRPQEEEMEEEGGGKRQKGPSGQVISTTQAEAATVAMVYSIFSGEDLQDPTIPDRKAIEKMILQAKKRQLKQEYVGFS
ncbi:hypothetical protein NDA18_001390 [Ustilago nuda]|nr:hypothetical protein NDA18_001390 [Ustilago nuda]